MKKLTKILTIGFIACCVIAISAVSIYRINEAGEAESSLEKQRPPITVSVVPVEVGEIRQWVIGMGTARMVDRRILNFRAAGKVVYVAHDRNGNPLREGSTISGPAFDGKKGQLLARLDDKQQIEDIKMSQAVLEEARHNLLVCKNELENYDLRFALAQKQMDRSTRLYNKKIMSLIEYEVEKSNYYEMVAARENTRIQVKLAESQIRKAETQLALGEIELEKTRLYAPFNGIVSYMNIAVGEFFSSELVDYTNESARLKTSAIVVGKQDQYEITVDLLASKGKQIRRNQDVFITWGDNYLTYGNDLTEDRQPHPFAKGTVYSITPGIDPGARIVKVKIRTETGGSHLRDGMPVNCLIVANKRENTLVIPKNALVFANNNPFVYVVDPDTSLVSRRTIEKGLEGFDLVEVKTGIYDRELLITEGRYRVEEGIKVNIM